MAERDAEDRPVVLFVDDEENLLAGLRRVLRPQVREWDLLFVSSGPEALDILTGRPVDIVVCDMRMPVMDGTQLLAEVQRIRPATARIILSGQADQEAVMAATGSAQQFLAKPCDVETLLPAIRRALRVRRLLADPRLREILGGVGPLPKPPTIYQKLQRAFSDPDVELADVVRVIAADIATSAEVLRLVNTAFFGLPRRVESVEMAVGLLGLDNIYALVLATSVFGPGQGVATGLSTAELRRVGMVRSALARRLAVADHRSAEDVNLVGLAGLLRDVGLLVLASAFPDRWAALRESGHGGGDADLDSRAELAAFGCTVPEASGYLLGLWGFGDVIVQSIVCQPVTMCPDGVPELAYLLDAAHHRARQPQVPLVGAPGTFLDLTRVERWNLACDLVLGRIETATGVSA